MRMEAALTFEATIYMYFSSLHETALEGDGRPAGRGCKVCEVLAISKERDADQEVAGIRTGEVPPLLMALTSVWQLPHRPVSPL